MLRHLFRRLLYAIPVLWVMVSAIFLLSRILPGAFGEQLFTDDSGFYSKGSQQQKTIAYEQLLKRTKQQLPLFYVGFTTIDAAETHTGYSYLVPDLTWNGTENLYHIWAAEVLTGSLGESFASTRPVTEVIAEAAGNTIWIMLFSMAITIVLALMAGITMVLWQESKWPSLLLSFLIVLDSLPLFVLSLLLLLLLASPDALQLFPVFGLGYSSVGNNGVLTSLLFKLPYLALPIFCLVLTNLPYLTNQFYSSLAGTMQAGYIKTARAKGLRNYSIITRHALRNALLPIITILSDMLPALVAGTGIIEIIFAIPGIGRLLVNSVLARDFPVIVGIVVVIAVFKMISHALADVLYALADPRIKNSAK
ncbi:ABC transporter permease [Pontibacter pudoricolor]|uniref:ABC transporter permease n=1 Tax=Pontibacter pudoricolor TaxID=2694930 RepID=UPI001391BE66|nr:ABC transporter permease [Pontibacter pudoricolor]